ncbi:NTP transferase domain-containing protein [Methanobrevibacter sp.]|uniref:NTP transferase domain-containing protein n=1 Tax=Methanobrevibacter sp. TaxID=66852 RepID=UPI0038703CF5
MIFIKKNAIILAAGKSNRIAPFTYEKPKGLFSVKGEILIERQIEQLIEAGIEDIIVVIGYMEEKFFYLERKYPEVKLVTNNTYMKFGNIYSMYMAREYLENTFICCADHYFLENPFIEDNELNQSYRASTFLTGNFREYSIDYSDAGVITKCHMGGSDSQAMIGHAYFNENFSQKFRELLEAEIDDFGITNMFWEDFYTKHIDELTLFVKEFEEGSILEFDSVDDLRDFDSDFLLNVDSEIVENICQVFECHPNDINNIEIINAGFTNVSFKFTVNDIDYVYRHPGGSDKYYSKRSNEVYSQNYAKKLGIDDSLIYIDPEGWKISYFIDDIVEFDLFNDDHRRQLMDAIHKTQEIPVTDEIQEFDTVKEGKKLIKLACATKGDLFAEFKDMFDKIDKVDELVKAEREKYGIDLVVSHHDIYYPNLLPTSRGEFFLIDWEYSSVNDPANDICGLITRYDFDDETIEFILREYYGRELTPLEHRHVMGQSIVTALYWISWPLFRASMGEENGFFLLTSFRYIEDHIDDVLESYKEL